MNVGIGELSHLLHLPGTISYSFLFLVLIVLLFFVYQPQKFGRFEEFNANFDIKSDLLCFKVGRLDFARALL